MIEKSIIVMGVTGSGKTTLGRALAEHTGFTFHDADDYHPAANVAKMSRGEPLTDEDRWPWLDELAKLLEQPIVLACSALRAVYRQHLRQAGTAQFVHLVISPELASQRLALRDEHFMPASLVASQFETLETPEDALALEADQPLKALIEQTLAAIEQPQ